MFEQVLNTSLHTMTIFYGYFGKKLLEKLKTQSITHCLNFIIYQEYGNPVIDFGEL